MRIKDGDISSTFTEDVLQRFEAYGWHTQHVVDGLLQYPLLQLRPAVAAINKAIDEAIAVTDKPSVIKVTTTIGYGSLLQGTGGVHGSPLKVDHIKQIKEKFNISPEPFFVPKE
jgi:transketolase